MSQDSTRIQTPELINWAYSKNTFLKIQFSLSANKNPTKPSRRKSQFFHTITQEVQGKQQLKHTSASYFITILSSYLFSHLLRFSDVLAQSIDSLHAHFQLLLFVAELPGQLLLLGAQVPHPLTELRELLHSQLPLLVGIPQLFGLHL